MVQTHKANRTETNTHERCRASSALSLQVMAGAVSINHSPEANRRGHPAGNPAACAEQRPSTAQCHLELMEGDSAGHRDLSSGPEGAAMELWSVPAQNTCVALMNFIWTFTRLNQLHCSLNTLTPIMLGNNSVADSMGAEIMEVKGKSWALAQQVSLCWQLRGILSPSQRCRASRIPQPLQPHHL